MPSYFFKSSIFILLIVFATGAGIYVTGRSNADNEVVAVNGTIPLLPQQGNALPLQYEMDKDRELKSALVDLGSRDAMRIFADYNAVDYLVSTILLHWTGSHMIASDARGPIVDARLVDFLEKTGSTTPLPNRIMNNDAAQQIRRLWYNKFQEYKAKLLMQTGARDMFIGAAGYDMNTDQIYVNGPLSSRGMQELISLLSYSENPKGIYSNFLVFVRYTKGLEGLSEEDKQLLRALRDEAKRLSPS